MVARLQQVEDGVVAAQPEEKASAWVPFSSAASVASSARRVGLSVRAYSKPSRVPPRPSCLKVDER